MSSWFCVMRLQGQWALGKTCKQPGIGRSKGLDVALATLRAESPSIFLKKMSFFSVGDFVLKDQRSRSADVSGKGVREEPTRMSAQEAEEHGALGQVPSLPSV